MCRLAMTGTANIEGREVKRAAAPADDVMQAFLWRHLVTMDEWIATINTERRPGGPTPRVVTDRPVSIPVGGQTDLKLALSAGAAADKVQLELVEPPDGIAIGDVKADRDRLSITLTTDAETVTPGLEGNLIANAFTERTRVTKDGKQLPPQRVPLGMLPAIPFRVAAK
jgi:hypothetical protein